jgi:hypothetical protein
MKTTPATLRRAVRVSITAAMLAAGTAPAWAADQDDDPWRFTVAPLLWGAGINGNVTVRNRSADVNVDFNQILDHTDAAFMAYFEARNSEFGLYLQPNYMRLSADGSIGPLEGSDTMKIWIVEGGAFYNIVTWGQDKPLTVDAVVGVRYWNLNNDLKLSGPNGRSFNAQSTQTLTDPLVGLRVQKHLTEKWSLNLEGDIGGFGISDQSSDFSWQTVGLVGYDFTRNISAFAGYRALGVRKEGSEKGADLVLSGALLGVEFTW